MSNYLSRVVNFFSDPSFSNTCQGNFHFGKETIGPFRGQGNGTLKGTTIRGLFSALGNLNMDSVSLHKLNAIGNVRMSHTAIEQESKFVGNLQATDSVFKREVTFCGKKGVFSGCQMESIRILKNNNSGDETQTIDLTNSRVNGSVIFESGKGKVILSSRSSVGGPVVGAEVIRKGYTENN